MARKLITRGWSPHSTALRVLFNMATVPDKTTGDLQTASPGLCGGHYNGGWAACPHSVKTVSWQRELRKARTDVWVCKSASISVSRESGSGREAAIIGDTHKSTDSIGDTKRATRSTDGAAKKKEEFLRTERQLALTFACREVKPHLLTWTDVTDVRHRTIKYLLFTMLRLFHVVLLLLVQWLKAARI